MTTWEWRLIEKLYNVHRYFFDRREYVQALIIAKFTLKFINGPTKKY